MKSGKSNVVEIGSAGRARLNDEVDELFKLPLTEFTDARNDHRNRHLPLAKSGHLERPREVRRRVVERVLHIVLGHLDLKAHFALRELLDPRPHGPAIVSEAAGVPFLQESGVGAGYSSGAIVSPRSRSSCQ